MVKTAIELGAMRLWNGDGLGSDRDAAPDVLDQLDALVDGQLVDLIQQGLGSHGRNVANRRHLGKMGEP